MEHKLIVIIIFVVDTQIIIVSFIAIIKTIIVITIIILNTIILIFILKILIDLPKFMKGLIRIY